MNKKSISKIILSMRSSMKKHSPEILTGIGIAGMISTVIMAVKATPKALVLIEKAKNEKEVTDLTPIETIKTVWTCYIPSTAIGVVSIMCLIGAVSVNVRRNAALATAYSLSESALRDYQEKVIQTIGSKKEQSVKDMVAKDKIDKNPVSKSEVIFTTNGETLCYDVISGRYFKSDIENLKKVENKINRQMRDEIYISLNDFYYEIGLDSISVGDELGWNIDKGYLELEFSSQLTDNGIPCLVVNYHVTPQYDYRK